jgi:hypothetical protein
MEHAKGEGQAYMTWKSKKIGNDKMDELLLAKRAIMRKRDVDFLEDCQEYLKWLNERELNVYWIEEKYSEFLNAESQ